MGWDQLTPMVTDFGISRPKGDPDATSEGHFGMRGTPSYMAPEQFATDGSQVGPLSDVYALGATLYSLLTGRPPFQAATTKETLALVRSSEPASPKALVPSLSRDLETIVLTCLKKEPQRRYASAGAPASDLQRWLDGFPIQARPVSKFEHAKRWCRRRPGVAVLLAVLILTVTSNLVGLFILWRRSETAGPCREQRQGGFRGASRLVGLLTETSDAPQLVMSERIEKASACGARFMVKLRRDQGVSAPNVVAIGNLARVLSWDLRRQGNNAESRALLTEALTFLGEMKNQTDDPRVDISHAKILIELGYVARSEANFDEALSFFCGAEKVLSGLVHDPRDLDVITLIDSLRRTIARSLDRGGQVEARRRFLESHIQMLERLNHDPDSNPVIGLLADLSRLSLASDVAACVKLRANLRRFPTGARLPQEIHDRLVDWILLDVDPYPSGTDAVGNPLGRLEPEAHADAVILAIESRCEAIGVDAGVFPAVAYEVAKAASYLGAGATKGRSTGRCPQNLGLSLRIREEAGTAESWRGDVSSREERGFRARSENCLAGGSQGLRRDRSGVAAGLGRSRDRIALDPKNFETRSRIASLQEKLIKLTAGRQSSRSDSRFDPVKNVGPGTVPVSHAP